MSKNAKSLIFMIIGAIGFLSWILISQEGLFQTNRNKGQDYKLIVSIGHDDVAEISYNIVFDNGERIIETNRIRGNRHPLKPYTVNIRHAKDVDISIKMLYKGSNTVFHATLENENGVTIVDEWPHMGVINISN